MKKALLFAVTLIAGGFACAVPAPTILACKVQSVKLDPNVDPSGVSFARKAIGLSEGDVFRLPVSKLAEVGDNYVMRAYRNQVDELTISRASGRFNYMYGVFGSALGTCEAETVKF
jgi:hypothetical protein